MSQPPSAPGLIFVMRFCLSRSKVTTIFLGILARPFLRRNFPDSLVATSLNTPVKIVAPWSRGCFAAHFYNLSPYILPLLKTPARDSFLPVDTRYQSLRSLSHNTTLYLQVCARGTAESSSNIVIPSYQLGVHLSFIYRYSAGEPLSMI